MNNAMRYSLSAVFTSLATSYFIGVGVSRLVQNISSRPAPMVSPLRTSRLGTNLAKVFYVRDDLFRPLGAPADPNEAMWRAIKFEQSDLRTQVENQVATLFRVEQQWRGSDRKVDAVTLKMGATERLMQETKNAMEEAQVRIGKLEGALKVAQDREQRATMTAKRMVKMFTTMSPEKAAKILEEWPNADAADLLARMKEAEAAAILAIFPPKRAAALSARLSGGRGGTP